MSDSEKRMPALFAHGSAVLFLLFFYFTTWLRLNPLLLYHRQEPAFLLSRHFIKTFLYPGGITEYASAFLSQFYQFPALGALLIALLSGVIYYLTHCYFYKKQPLLSLIPVILLAVMQNNYKHTIVVATGIILALLFALCQRSFKKSWVRLIVFVVLLLVLYSAAAGYALFFALLCFMNHFSLKKEDIFNTVLQCGLILSLTAALPLTTYYRIAQNTWQNAWFYLLPLDQKYISFVPMLFFAAYPVILLFTLIQNKIRISNRLLSLILPPVIAGTGMLFVWLTFDKDTRTHLSMDYYARHNNWETVLNIAQQKNTNNRRAPIAFLVNQALCFDNSLLDNMFVFPQNHGIDGLFMTDRVGMSACVQNSDFFFRLGHLNEARHWGHEALSAQGQTAYLLERLAFINLLLGDHGASRKFQTLLAQAPFVKQEKIQQLSRYANNIPLPPHLMRLQKGIPEQDFITNTKNPAADMLKLAQQSSQNRAALEYLLAYYLLKGRIGLLTQYLDLLPEAGYTRLPRHIQEALLFYISSGRSSIDADQYKIDMKVKQRFYHFNQLMKQHKSSKKALYAALSKQHRNTYWFYLMFNMPEQYKKISSQQ